MGSLNKVTVKVDHMHAINPPCPVPGAGNSYGWVEVDPALGAKGFSLPADQIQNNRWFQNYSIWMRESKVEKQPTWTADEGKFRSDYGVEHIISYSRSER